MATHIPQEQERASLIPKKHHPVWHRRAKDVPRWARWVLVVALVYGIFALARGICDLLDQDLKSRATDFSGLHQQGAEFWTPAYVERQKLRQDIDDRYHYVRHLASGQEGSVDVYIDQESARPVVAKSYRRSPRNPIPHTLLTEFSNFTSSWPTEIEAGLLLSNYSGFVPVIDYFILVDDSQWSWTLVSPFMSNGTLDKLAQEESLSNNNSLHELDVKYRPSLISLLHELRPLHNAKLCHDDVKMDNVFLRSGNDWLLGDLGNMRQFSHPWHTTNSWRRQNQWADCKSNDIRRALKTYLWFLRSSTADTDEFDRKFWAGEVSWARLYWNFARSPADFHLVVEMLPGDDSSVSETTAGDLSSSERAIATERELTCTTLARRLWPWYWRYAPIW